jgi:hypothetical protein
MKAKTFVACVLTASALPLAPALAQNATQPGGPQGTGWYGAPNAAVPVPELVSPADTYATPLPQDRTILEDRRVYERGMRRGDARRPMRERGVYDGPSWSTNPPAPPA